MLQLFWTYQGYYGVTSESSYSQIERLHTQLRACLEPWMHAPVFWGAKLTRHHNFK